MKCLLLIVLFGIWIIYYCTWPANWSIEFVPIAPARHNRLTMIWLIGISCGMSNDVFWDAVIKDRVRELYSIPCGSVFRFQNSVLCTCDDGRICGMSGFYMRTGIDPWIHTFVIDTRITIGILNVVHIGIRCQLMFMWNGERCWEIFWSRRRICVDIRQSHIRIFDKVSLN